MKISELTKGNLYVSRANNTDYIFQYEGEGNVRHNYLCNDLSNFGKGDINSNTNDNFKDYRDATEEERIHWNACLKANKFVAKPAVFEPIFEV